MHDMQSVSILKECNSIWQFETKHISTKSILGNSQNS